MSDHTSSHPALQHIPVGALPSPAAARLAATILSGDTSLDLAISLAAAHFLTEGRVDVVAVSLTSFTPEDQSGWTRLGGRAWVREWVAPGATCSVLPAPGAGAEAALTLPWLSPRARLSSVVLIDTEMLPDEAGRDRVELENLGIRSLIGSTFNAGAHMFGSLSMASTRSGCWPVHLVADLRLLNAAISSRFALLHSRRALADEIAAGATARVAHQQFLASIGHELRTPLAAIVGYTEVLMDDARREPPDPAASKLLADGPRILRACEQLVSVVDNLLDAGRTLASGDTREDVVVADAIADVLHWYATPARTAQVTISTSVESSRTVWAHPASVRQVLTNLVSNAVNHNHRGGWVHLSVEPLRGESGEDRLRIIVRDDGPGLEPDQLNRVFEPFVRFAAAESKGSGLGLPMCRTIAARDGGTVRGESTPGAGSAFWLELPAARPSQA